MANHTQQNQAYLHWYFGINESQAGEQEILPQDIIPIPKTTPYTNPWVFQLSSTDYRVERESTGT